MQHGKAGVGGLSGAGGHRASLNLELARMCPVEVLQAGWLEVTRAPIAMASLKVATHWLTPSGEPSW